MIRGELIGEIFKFYLCLALISGMAAWAWQSMRLPTSLPQTFPMHFYQQVIGSLDGRKCPSYPVCSLYARQALDKHGWLIGSWLMLDRLIHEADDLHDNHRVLVDGENRSYDPLERNDFWL